MTDGVTWRAPSEFDQDLLDRYGLTCPPRWGTPRNPARKTLGPNAAKVMRALGCEPMPWQRYVLDVALEIDPDTGNLFYRKVGISVPRQQGKTELVFTLMVFRAMAWPNQNVIYAAQTRSDARKRWEDELLARLDASPLRGKYFPRKTNGNEAILFKHKGPNSRIGITANTEKAGHGPPLDLGMIDEAFAHTDDRLEQAMGPAMSTRNNAQMYWVSAGGTTKSVFLNKKRDSGRQLIERQFAAGEFDEKVAHFEWYAPEDMPRDSVETWQKVMPALGTTVQPETVRAELVSMDEPEFDRAYLNRTRKPTPPEDPNVPKREWPRCVGEAPAVREGEKLAFGIDVAPSRDYASISVAILREDGGVHVELVDRRTGTDWVVPVITKLRDRWKPVAIALDRVGPAGSLLDDLAVAGITVPAKVDSPAQGDLAIPKTYEASAACGQLADAIRQGKITHIDQALLTGAVNGAATRVVNEAWMWNRRTALVDISPLVAATLARWALLTRIEAIPKEYDVLNSIF
jgi:hypothetical protein